MSLRDDLIAVKALIDTPEKWIKSPDETTECRCAALACTLLKRRGGCTSSAYTMWQALYYQLPGEFQKDDGSGAEIGVCIGRFNDHRFTTHADVMALFDRAIAACGDAS